MLESYRVFITKKILWTSKTKTAQTASFKYVGIKLLNLSWPAVSHSWSLQVDPLYDRFLPKKSIPMVGWVMIFLHFLYLRICHWRIFRWLKSCPFQNHPEKWSCRFSCRESNWLSKCSSLFSFSLKFINVNRVSD